ncbi:hypothetical protein K8I61_13330, partial [bacterium]|nr:hypothetical protein [bacterium]
RVRRRRVRAAAFAFAVAFASGAGLARAQDEFDTEDTPPEIDMPLEIDDDPFGGVAMRAAASIGLAYILPTVPDKDDVRHEDAGSFEGFLRGAALSLYGDLAPRLDARLSISAAHRRDLDLDQDGAGDDPHAGRVVAVLSAAYVSWYASPALHVRAGMIPLPWSIATGDAWRHTWALSAASRRFGITNGWDLGVSASGALPRAIGAYGFAVVNGEGSAREEDNRYKEAQGVLRVRPLPFGGLAGIILSGAVIYEMRDDPPGTAIDRRVAYAGLLQIPVWLFDLGLEGGVQDFHERTDRDPIREAIASAYANLELRHDAGVFVRADARDPDISERSGRESRLSSRIEGLALAADEDRRLYLAAGGYYVINHAVQFGPFVSAVFYEERAGGETVAPSVAVNFVTTLVF